MNLDTILNTDSLEKINEFYDLLENNSNKQLNNFTPICPTKLNDILSKGKFFNFTSQSGLDFYF